MKKKHFKLCCCRKFGFVGVRVTLRPDSFLLEARHLVFYSISTLMCENKHLILFIYLFIYFTTILDQVYCG